MKVTRLRHLVAKNRKAENGSVKLDVILNNDIMDYIGYYISSIEDNIGEIESIFIENNIVDISSVINL